jgi:FlaG/FlaF family flagellin (archaellin)
MRKLRRNKKGLSTVISTLLMILVVMVGMSIVFGFIANYSKAYQVGSGSSVLESMTIEDVWFKNATSSSVELWAYNIGKVSFTINSLYVNNTLATFTVNGRTDTQNVQIAVGGHADIIMKAPVPTFPPGWIPNNSYHFKIVTGRGSALEGTYIPLGQ